MLHHLIIGTWTPPAAIFTVEFDDEALTLQLIKRTALPEDEPISWMTFDHAKKNVYGASMKKWSSNIVTSPTEITHHTSRPIGGDPSKSDTRTRAIFVLATKKPPYNVYGNPFYEHAGYGNVFSVDSNGALAENIQNYEYSPQSAIHGMVFDPEERYLYSADMWGNRIWTHKKDPDTGLLTLAGSIEAPKKGDHPRWVAIHPSGKYVYVLMEAGNCLAVYVIDEQTHLPVFTHITYPLVPPGAPGLKTKMYRSDVVCVSHSGKYLFATSRSNDFKVTGYIAAFKLGPSGEIKRQICLNPTPTSGGHSNAISPCDWSDEWLALTDDQEGWVEIYRWNEEFLCRVARVDIPEPGFGMNAIWYD
ncbi:hypothetical protein B7494_g539 [Chlorociboria aeruginascens]|nr:hypothetical protein B7494_g539 [Chlorociboria aeruginascens]